MIPKCVFVMGVAGSGKTTVGKRLTDALEAEFIDGDDYHTPENRSKMANGIALTDEDRFPWLERLANIASEASTPIIVACSALKPLYRQLLTANLSGDFVFLQLDVERSELERRLRTRKGHFFDSQLLDSQLKTLTLMENEKHLFVVNAGKKIDETVQDALNVLYNL